MPANAAPSTPAKVVALPHQDDYPARRPRGRQPKELGPVVVDWELAEMATRCTGGLISTAEVARMLGLSRRTLDDHCKQEHGCTFTKWANQYRTLGKAEMLAALYRNGKAGNASAAKHWLERALGPVDMQQAKQAAKGEPVVQYVIPANGRDPALAKRRQVPTPRI